MSWLGQQATPTVVAFALWALWLVSWLAASGWSKRAAKRPSMARQAPDRFITALGVLLLFANYRIFNNAPVTQQLYALSGAPAWSLTGLVALGILFAWWARIHLGSLWSGNVTQKEGHRIIETGPYAIVRHPIYTGLLLSAYALAGLRAAPVAFAGAALITLGWYLKARLEERFLSGDLGPEYAAYRARVPMLVPFIGV
ncbi:MAG: isoprenylcysteine carboxylmethyltransferase family protein [Alphaproteobacteria bacterium]